MKAKKIEAEGSELILRNEHGDYVIIPKKHRLEVSDMVKEGCNKCIDAYIETLPVMKDYAEDGSLIPEWMNPKNWGVTDYSEKGNFNVAYQSARKAGEKEFMWNNKRYSTNYKGTPQQQLKETGITDKQRLSNNFIRDRIENNLYDFEYHDKNQDNEGDILFPLKKMKKIIINNEKESDFLNVIGEIPEDSKTHKDLLSLYLGKPQKYSTVNISKYIPSDSKEINKEYFSINNKEFQNYILKHLDENYISGGLNSGKIKQVKDKKGNIILNRYIISDIGTGLGEFTISKGEDINGKYISYWDKWDLNPYKGQYSAADISNIDDFGIGKPFDIYDRIYYRENPDANKYAEYDKKISDLWDLAIKTQDTKYVDEANKLYSIRNSYYDKQGKYIRQYYSDKELFELDVNKKNFDTLALQRELNNRGYKLPKSSKKDGSFDGIWGEETKNALHDWQKNNANKNKSNKFKK